MNIVKIQIVYDTICPWCYIGKKRLEQAKGMRPNIKTKISWRPFLLNPAMPHEGMDRQEYLERKFGSRSRSERVYGAIEKAGKDDGIDFHFDKISRTPCSIDSHRLVLFAQSLGLGDAVVERLQLAFFMEGRDIGLRRDLIDISEEGGLDRKTVKTFLEGKSYENEVLESNSRAHGLGIEGVPAFIFNDNFLVSGAQEATALARMLDLSAADLEMTQRSGS